MRLAILAQLSQKGGHTVCTASVQLKLGVIGEVQNDICEVQKC